MTWSVFERTRITEARSSPSKLRPETASLLALRGQGGGPDRIRTGDLVLDRDVC
jgi:hypothetical protein